MGVISPKLYQLVTQLVIDTLSYHLINSNTLCPSVFATGHTDCDSQSANTKTLQFHLYSCVSVFYYHNNNKHQLDIIDVSAWY